MLRVDRTKVAPLVWQLPEPGNLTCALLTRRRPKGGKEHFFSQSELIKPVLLQAELLGITF